MKPWIMGMVLGSVFTVLIYHVGPPTHVVLSPDHLLQEALANYRADVQQMRDAMERLVGKLVDLLMENRQLTAYILKHDPELRLAWETKQEREDSETLLRNWVEAEFMRR